MASTIKQRLRRYNGADYDTIHLETQESQIIADYSKYAPAGFGIGINLYDDPDSYTIRAESRTESYETYCARVAAMLETMDYWSFKFVLAYPPEIWGMSSIPLCIPFKRATPGICGILMCLGDCWSGYGSYGSWRMSAYNSVWQPFEWIDPPLMDGVEYRTTERYLRMPVYVKRVDHGYCSPGYLPKSISSTINDLIVSVTGCCTGYVTRTDESQIDFTYERLLPAKHYSDQYYINIEMDTNPINTPELNLGSAFSKAHIVTVAKYCKFSDVPA